MALQRHIHQYGIFGFFASDLGSPIQSVINMISTVLDDNETKAFLDSHGIRNIDYHLYPKGNSSLDSLVETPVKPE